MSNSRITGHLLALFVSVVWGTTFISTKVLLTAFHPVEIMIFRFVIAWAALFCCAPRPLLPRSLKGELPFLGAALTGLTLYFMLENYALTMALASTVGIIISAAPMFTALLLWVCRRTRRPSTAFFAGFAIAMLGITLISVAKGEALEFHLLGSLLTLGAALSWGFYGVCVELTRATGFTNLQVTRKIFFWGLLFTLPFVFAGRLSLSPAPFADPKLLFNILYLGLGASALCFVAWNRAVVILGPVATNVYIYLMPVITLAASALILGEPVTLPAVGAIALILLGLWLSQRRRKALPEP